MPWYDLVISALMCCGFVSLDLFWICHFLLNLFLWCSTMDILNLQCPDCAILRTWQMYIWTCECVHVHDDCVSYRKNLHGLPFANCCLRFAPMHLRLLPRDKVRLRACAHMWNYCITTTTSFFIRLDQWNCDASYS